MKVEKEPIVLSRTIKAGSYYAALHIMEDDADAMAKQNDTFYISESDFITIGISF